MRFSEIIGAIQSEIRAEYLPGAIAWADTEYNGAWSKAIERFELALTASLLNNNNAQLADEGEIYKRTVIGLLRQFKARNDIAETDEFLSALRKR